MDDDLPVAFFFALVAGRLGYLQLYCHAALQERVNREQSRTQGSANVPSRGAILDRTGAVLAMSIQGGACFADPHRVQNADETARLLAPLLHESPAASRLNSSSISVLSGWPAGWIRKPPNR